MDLKGGLGDNCTLMSFDEVVIGWICCCNLVKDGFELCSGLNSSLLVVELVVCIEIGRDIVVVNL